MAGGGLGAAGGGGGPAAPGPVERLLSRAGVPGHLARLLVATPALSRAWVVAVVVVLACAVAVGQAARDVGASYLLAFLVAAPVLPLAGIAPAYGRHVDPVHETQAATPMAGPRLLLLRAGAVLATAVVLTAAASPWLPGPPGRGAGWLLPSLALSVGFAAAGRHRAGGRGVRAGGTRRGGSRGTARRRAADRAGRERVAGRAAGGLAVPYR
ncbi:hypothetical protein ACBJ59_22935 [Nonomuraea sp. MTCD27]|uniref:hypothetical protein n=1 Tax=Nonomuraea sp. MTCD27 TaxID=1676747 RepID=UPI0035BFCA6C